MNRLPRAVGRRVGRVERADELVAYRERLERLICLLPPGVRLTTNNNTIQLNTVHNTLNTITIEYI